MTKSTTFCKLE